jgi:hypothetical protein
LALLACPVVLLTTCPSLGAESVGDRPAPVRGSDEGEPAPEPEETEASGFDALFRGTGRLFTGELPDVTEAPSIRLIYGQADLSLHGLEGSFATTGVAEARLGYTDLRSIDGGITAYDSSEFCVTRFTSELGPGAEAEEIEYTIWRFAVSQTDGYGYDFGNLGVVPYYSGALCASNLELGEAFDSSLDEHRVGRFTGSYRFGTAFEGGVRLTMGPHVELGVGYERAVIFKRWLFWKWAGSELLESAAIGIVDEFVEEIRARVPKAAPIVGFVLKNAISYAAYELRKEDMNFPFDTADPLFLETYAVGVTFVF